MNSNSEDLTGKQFGKLTVVKRLESRITKEGKKQAQWLCHCACGNDIIAITAKLKSGHTKSCGCLRSENASKHIDLVGKKFGRLTVIEYIPLDKRIKPSYMWLCKCECGNFKALSTNNLTSGKVLSCGCYNREYSSKRALKMSTTHGLSDTRLYNIWCAMKQRCLLPSSHAYKDYGGRGITICDEWKNNFQTFFDWAIANGYEDNLSIDRIDNNGDYEPINCRWVSNDIQSYNKRTTLKISIYGEMLTVKEICDKYGVSKSALFQRYYRGITDEERLLYKGDLRELK